MYSATDKPINKNECYVRVVILFSPQTYVGFIYTDTYQIYMQKITRMPAKLPTYVYTHV